MLKFVGILLTNYKFVIFVLLYVNFIITNWSNINPNVKIH